MKWVGAVAAAMLIFAVLVDAFTTILDTSALLIASVGFYESPWGTKHPRIQILTVGALLEGKGIDAPPSRDIRTFKKAPKTAKKPTHHQPEMFDEAAIEITRLDFHFGGVHEDQHRLSGTQGNC